MMASFGIVRNSGQLQTKAELDYETKNSYMVTVTATDSDSASSSIDVTIKLTDEDEAPIIMLGGLTISGTSMAYYEENRMDAVETYMANGPMAGRARWSLAGEDVGDFMLASDGMLKFRSSPNYEMPRDADTDNTYKVTVKANDGTYTDTQDVIVMVTDVEELGTLSGNSRHNYMENGEDAVATYTPSGPDAATWSLEGTDKGYFTITDGMLKFRSSPNYEMPRDADTDNIYMVIVKAQAGGEMDDILVAVTVDNVEELGMLSGLETVSNYMENSDAAVGTYTVSDGPMAEMANLVADGRRHGRLHHHRRGTQFQERPRLRDAQGRRHGQHLHGHRQGRGRRRNGYGGCHHHRHRRGRPRHGKPVLNAAGGWRHADRQRGPTPTAAHPA